MPVRHLEMLIRLKRAAGRPKDLERIAELEALSQERRSADRDGPEAQECVLTAPG